MKRCLSRRFSRALAFAEELHAYRQCPSNDGPFVGHALGVCSIVLLHGGDEDEAVAALMLESLEVQTDPAMLARIGDRFGERVAAIVGGLLDVTSDAGRAHLTWLDRKRAYVRRLRESADLSVHFVGAADALQAARSIAGDYARQGEAFWLRLATGKPGQLWYFDELLVVYGSAAADPRRRAIVEELTATLQRIKSLSAALTTALGSFARSNVVEALTERTAV